MDYRRNEDYYGRRGEQWAGPSQAAVYEVVFTEESSGDEQTIIPLAEVKNFCKIDIDEDDALLDELQLAAIIKCESLLNIGFKQRETTAIIDNRNGDFFLPYGPIASVSMIKDVAPVDKQTSGIKWTQIIWPREDHLTVVYIGGYSTLPMQIKIGLLQCIFYLYDERKRRDDPFPPIYLETLKPFSRK